MMTLPKKKFSSAAGFTLIELAVVITILGIIITGAAFAYPRYIYQLQVEATNRQLDTIMNVLSTYVQRNNRLPCPSLPTGNGYENKPITTTSGDTSCYDNSSSEALYETAQGVLPWRELGIPESMARDAWGRLITYKPAPQLTLNNNSTEQQNLANDDAYGIHNACRSPMWYTINSAGDVQHVNRGKALFCCNASAKPAYQAGGMPTSWKEQSIRAVGQAYNQSLVQSPAWMDARPNDADSPGQSQISNFNGNFAHPHSVGFGPDGNEMAQPKGDSPLMRSTSTAVTLISHGGNGFLAYILNGGLQQEDAPSISNAEIANATDYARTAGTVYNPKMMGNMLTGNGYDRSGLMHRASDDIVSYIRSDQLYAKAGNASCQPNVSTHNCAMHTTSEFKPMQNVSYMLDKSTSMDVPLYCGSTLPSNSQYCGWTYNQIVDDAMAWTAPRIVEAKLNTDPNTTDSIQLSGLFGSQPPVAINPAEGLGSISYNSSGQYTGTNSTVATLQAQISSLPYDPGGASPIAQSVLNSAQALGTPTDPQKPNVLVVMTDGSNNKNLQLPCSSCPGGYTTYVFPSGSITSAQADAANTAIFDALTNYITTNYPDLQIYSVQIAPFGGAPNAVDKQNLKNLAESTGGRYLQVSSPDDLRDIFNSIAHNSFLTCL